MAETVVGATTGVVPAPIGYFKGECRLQPFIPSIPVYNNSVEAMKSVCDKYGALFILDEVRLFNYVLDCVHLISGDEWHGSCVILTTYK